MLRCPLDHDEHLALHDVHALRAAQRAAQEIVQPLVREMTQLALCYQHTRFLLVRDPDDGTQRVTRVEHIWNNAEAEALYKQYAAMVRQILEHPPGPAPLQR